jgi:hypothetical protein
MLADCLAPAVGLLLSNTFWGSVAAAEQVHVRLCTQKCTASETVRALRSPSLTHFRGSVVAAGLQDAAD